MFSIALTIAPIFALILMGYVFKRTGFPGDGFWAPAEKLAYYVLLPVLIVNSMARADLSAYSIPSIAFTIVGVAVCMTAVSFILRPVCRFEGPVFTSFLQGAIRINSYMALAIADAVFGNQGVALGALFIAVMMPTVNVISIAALAAFNSAEAADWSRVPREIVRNPIILACLVGWIVNIAAVPLPGALLALMDILARAALPVALLAVGAGLVLALGRARVTALGLACLLKLAAMPATAWVLASEMGLNGLAFSVVILFAATPASPASYVLARQMGGDAPLMAAILTSQIALAALSLPLVLFWTM
jgi:predicted permease